LHLTLRARLAIGLAIIAMVLVTPLVVTRNALHTLHEDVRELRRNEFGGSLVLGRLRDRLADVRSRAVALELVQTDTVHTQLREAIVKARLSADSLVYFTSEGTDGKDSSAKHIVASLDAIGPIADRELAAFQAGKADEGDSLSQNALLPALYSADSALSPVELVLRQRTQRRVEDAETALSRTEDVSIAALAVALGIATLIALWLTRSISGPVGALERGMRAVAEGELEHSLDLSATRRDEFGRLAESFQLMSRQLAELDKLKAEFVSVASHELKTPINVILGYLQLMQQGLYGPLSPKQVEVLSTVEAQGKTLARLASHLLDVTRFEAGGGRIEPRDVHLVDMLEDLERAFHVLAVQRGVTFRVSLRPGLPESVYWDVDRINEVMGNLLANAFKFTPDGGRVELTAAPSGDQVLIEVSDTGAGIPAAQLPHIFEKFYQADNQGSASAPGSGLGLAIAKEIVEAHRGTIECTSTPGGGTTFTLLLPQAAGHRRRTDQHRVAQLEAVS
jgi:signal transduction histidine kinase